MANNKGITLAVDIQLMHYSDLEQPYLTAIMMKYRGQMHSAISVALTTEYGEGFSKSTIDHWFEKVWVQGTNKGILRQAYDQYKGDKNAEILMEADDVLVANVKNAAIVQSNLLKSPDDNVKLKASQAILDRVKGKPAEKDEGQGKGTNVFVVVRGEEPSATQPIVIETTRG